MSTKNPLQPKIKDFGSSFCVVILPVREHNFTYLIHDKKANMLSVVDISDDMDPVIAYVKTHFAHTPFHTILSTHHHFDHVDGNLKIHTALGSDKPFDIIGGANEAIPGVTQEVREGDKVSFGSLEAYVVDVPCHTRGHVMFKVYNPTALDDGNALFTGDTFFVGGVGAPIESNLDNVSLVLPKLYNINGDHAEKEDAQTFIFPGHEHTVKFLTFSNETIPAAHPDAPFIAKQLERYEKRIAQKEPAIPSTLAEEKRQNLYLRAYDPDFVAAMNHGNSMKELLEYLYNVGPVPLKEYVGKLG